MLFVCLGFPSFLPDFNFICIFFCVLQLDQTNMDEETDQKMDIDTDAKMEVNDVTATNMSPFEQIFATCKEDFEANVSSETILSQLAPPFEIDSTEKDTIMNHETEEQKNEALYKWINERIKTLGHVGLLTIIEIFWSTNKPIADKLWEALKKGNFPGKLSLLLIQ